MNSQTPTVAACTAVGIWAARKIVGPIVTCATAMAVSIFVIHLLGDAAAPLVIGAVSDRVGLSNAVLIMPGFVALSAVIWLIAAWRPDRYGRA